MGCSFTATCVVTTFYHNDRFYNSTPNEISGLTIATADALLKDNAKRHYGKSYKDWARRYPSAGYGGKFDLWVHSDSLEPYNSHGNGSAMRISPVGWAFATLEETLGEAKRSADATHNHPGMVYREGMYCTIR